MLTVTAVLAPPNYTEAHLARLFALVVENINQPFLWQPVTDSPWRGWWAKCSLWEPGRFEGRVLYLDLDTTPCGPLDDLAADEFTMCRDWATLGLNSSVMAWNGGTDDIWARWMEGPEHHMQAFRGDQDFIASVRPEAATFRRGLVQSYKADILPGRRHPDCRVIAYHGQPKPWDVEAA